MSEILSALGLRRDSGLTRSGSDSRSELVDSESISVRGQDPDLKSNLPVSKPSRVFDRVNESRIPSAEITVKCPYSALSGRFGIDTLDAAPTGVKSSPGLMNRSASSLYCLS